MVWRSATGSANRTGSAAMPPKPRTRWSISPSGQRHRGAQRLVPRHQRRVAPRHPQMRLPVCRPGHDELDLRRTGADRALPPRPQDLGQLAELGVRRRPPSPLRGGYRRNRRYRASIALCARAIRFNETQAHSHEISRSGQGLYPLRRWRRRQRLVPAREVHRVRRAGWRRRRPRRRCLAGGGRRAEHADRLSLPAAFQGQDRRPRHGPQPHRRQGRRRRR